MDRHLHEVSLKFDSLLRANPESSKRGHLTSEGLGRIGEMWE